MDKQALKAHPIQLAFVGVKELHVKTHLPPTPDNDIVISAKQVKINIGHGEYDNESRLMPVQLTLEIGKSNEKISKIPLYIKVVIIGVFKTEEKKPNVDAFNRFIKNNALHLLHPFLREHVFALSARCGVRPIVLPLVTVTPPSDKKTIVKK